MRSVFVALLICGTSLDAIADISMNPNTLDAGSALIGSTTTSGNGTLSYQGQNPTIDLTIGSCTGSGAGSFVLSASDDINLSSPVQINVSYTPSARGTRECIVTARHASGGGGSQGTFRVRGTGLAPQTMTVMGNTEFGSLRWNNAAPNHDQGRNFTVTNGGDVSLNVTNVAISGTNAGDFSITAGGTSQTILPQNSRTWTINFDPSAGGARTATLTFTSNDPANPTRTFNLTGTGTNAVITTSDHDFNIVNTGSSAQADITLTNSAGAPVGPLGVTSATISGGAGWFTIAGCGTATSCTFTPAHSITTTKTVGVLCSPPATANANDTQMATVTFSSDTDGATPDNVANLKCTAGKSDLATNQAIVAFTPQLVTTTTNANTVTITNNGNVATTFYLTKSGANQSSYTITTPTACGTSGTTNQCSIGANGGTAMFSVTFTPGTEGDISAGLTVTPAIGVPVQVSLTGRGIDRHIELVDFLQAPDTFRNPGDMAALVPVTIKNAGEYPLRVSGLVLDGAPNWQLATELEPFDVPGLGSKDVMVEFTPVTAGKAPDAILAVMSDDAKSPLLNVIISGNGKDRNVGMGPGVIDFGNTGAGVPVTLTSLKESTDWLTVINMDETAFKIREITLDKPDVFKVHGLGGDDISNLDLPAGAMNQFEIVFLPPKVGEYTANMTLYLDQDPLGQRTIEVRGNALFVDAHGGGGCSTGRGAGAGILVVLAALLRRKRRRA